MTQPISDTKNTVQNALDNYDHGRRVFALRQLEELVGADDHVSRGQKWYEDTFVAAQRDIILHRDLNVRYRSQLAAAEKERDANENDYHKMADLYHNTCDRLDKAEARHNAREG